MLTLANLGQYAGPGTLALKTLESALKGFVFPNADFRHCFPSPRAHRDATPGISEYTLLYRLSTDPVKRNSSIYKNQTLNGTAMHPTPNVLYD